MLLARARAHGRRTTRLRTMSNDEAKGAVRTELTAEQATQMLSLEVAKRRRITTATQSGSRLVTIGLVGGIATGAALWLLPRDGGLGWAPWALGGLATLIGGFGVLRLLAAWQLGRH